MSEIALKNNLGTSSTGDQSMHYVKIQRLVINVFFDGTNNNYYNVETKKKRPGQGSYTNGLTNIARMWNALDEEGKEIAVYIEGMGTARDQDDSIKGFAFGEGPYGIKPRVHGAFAAIQKAVKNSDSDAQLPALVQLNVFGFSRGAASARYFVHLVNAEPQRFKNVDKWENVKVSVGFVGLFDTVSGLGWSSNDDVAELHLNFEPNYAYKVFHLIAGDEYRRHYPVTTIASAIGLRVISEHSNHAMGYELRIPGAHSNVGGSYLATEVETHDFSYAMQNFIYDQGWYTPEQRVGPRSLTHERTVLGQYEYIPLILMIEMARKYCTTPFPAKLTTEPEQPPLVFLLNKMRQAMAQEKETTWDLNKRLSEKDARMIRAHFLHISFEETSVPHPPRLPQMPPRRPDEPIAPYPPLQREYIQG